MDTCTRYVRNMRYDTPLPLGAGGLKDTLGARSPTDPIGCCVFGGCGIPVASLASRLSIAHRRHVQIASSALVRSSSRGRGRLAPQAARDAATRARRALRGAVGACWLMSGDPSREVQSASARANGPASPRSPPLVAALWLARGSIWTIVSGLWVRRVAMERSEERHRGLLGR